MEETRDSDQFHGVIDDKDLRKAPNGNLLVLDLMDRRAVEPDARLYLDIFKKCTDQRKLKDGQTAHAHFLASRFRHYIVLQNTAVNMYAKCGDMEMARKAFDEMTERDMVSYTMLITGYSQISEFDEALRLYVEMVEMGLQPNEFTFGSALKSAGGMQSDAIGRGIHGACVKCGYEDNVYVGSALVDMYARCNKMAEAKVGFDGLKIKNEVSWNALIAAYAREGEGHNSVKLFAEMKRGGFGPAHFSYSSIFAACASNGALEQGKWVHADMLKMELGAYAAERVFELDPHDSGPHMLLSNIYASAGRLNDAARVRKMMTESGIKKEPACSWVEIGNVVHLFVANDDSHPQRQEIRVMWEKLRDDIKKIVYVPDTSHALWYSNQQEREERLQDHSEKLALAFALLNTPNGAPISIKKNIRVCGDCHAAFKFVSKLVDREIILRDTNRFHHFRHGSCSCRDYW